MVEQKISRAVLNKTRENARKNIILLLLLILLILLFILVLLILGLMDWKTVVAVPPVVPTLFGWLFNCTVTGASGRRVRDRVSRPVRSPPKSSRAVLSQIVGDDAVAYELAQLDACQAGLEKASRAGVRTQARVSTTSYRPRTASNPPPRVSPGNVLQRHATAEAYTGRLSCRDPSVALFARPATAGYWSSQEKLLRFD